MAEGIGKAFSQQVGEASAPSSVNPGERRLLADWPGSIPLWATL